jgi:hypothetical protein
MTDSGVRDNEQRMSFEYPLNPFQYTYNPQQGHDTPSHAFTTINLGLDFIAQQPYIQPLPPGNTAVTEFYGNRSTTTTRANAPPLAKVGPSGGRGALSLPKTSSVTSITSKIPSLSCKYRTLLSAPIALASTQPVEVIPLVDKPKPSPLVTFLSFPWHQRPTSSLFDVISHESCNVL